MKVIDINTWEIIEEWPDIQMHSLYTTKEFWKTNKVDIKKWEDRQKKIINQVIENKE